ncbi:hypothetical protein BGW36DRAFT_169975 [Talaromyces proteolyticus]|uniref:Protein kinase domain-containing protein n=1 Tax=Talaromyces proteolyticus TaxID=1131652 RepID=A0AAD4KV44_9EURO|nr:uncharacterized protein BGW36DRAFT_169975 [Talaromyces proteolyticus]KAH8697600.1 hypothetical protein BGW36DRAFT_169975 [Talaromyces proteolyticus]
MAADTYDNLCHEIYGRLYSQLERRDEERYRFAPKGTVKGVLHPDILMRFFQSLLLPGQTAMDQFNLTENDLVVRVDERKLYDYLAILIFGACRIQAARTFTIALVAVHEWPVVSSRGEKFHYLPTDRKELLELFHDDVTVDKFCIAQPCFCPVVIRKRMEVSIKNLEAQRLPYLEEQLLSQGSFGTVYKVKIAKGHFYNPRDRTANLNHEELARKDYRISPEFRAQEEREIMEKILNSSSHKCRNILYNYGSLDISPTTYSLFMPLAICDLKAYMTEYHRTKPNTTMEKAKIIQSAKGLAGALNFLHNEMKTADMEELVCYHMDLKPSNILIFREESNNETNYVWKLSDFGMARVKIRHRDHNSMKEKDFNSVFIPRPKPHEPSSSLTISRHGEGTYLAPESVSSRPSMNRESDVWSLGCVISVVFAYLEEGGDGVTRYQDARVNHPHADGYDRFFLRNTNFTPLKVHPVISKWHSFLIERAEQRHPEEGAVVKFMLRYLESSVFEVKQTKRHGVKEVESMLLETYKKYNKLERDDPDPGRRPVPPSPKLWHRIRPRSARSADRQVDVWNLSPLEPFKGCQISPNGTYVAYWTDIKISLYTSHSVSLQNQNLVKPAAEYSLESEYMNCIWKEIALTQRYLVASTTGANFQCYIFDLEAGRSVDPSLNYWYKVSLFHPEISKLAISPDSKALACVLRDKEEGENKSSLFLAPMSELIRIGKKLQEPPIDETSSSELSSGDSRMSNSDPWSLGKLDWPATNITHFSFSTTEEIYMVVRPELTVRSIEHRISILYLNLPTRKLYPLDIRSLLDTNIAAALFTTFAPFRQQAATCAVVTREKQLYIRNIIENDPSAAIEKKIKNYRVLRLIMGWRDEKILALGTPSASHKMFLLEMTVPRSENDSVSVTELTQIPGLSYDDEFIEMLSDESGEKYVLIAALAGAKQSTIYKVHLPGV